MVGRVVVSTDDLEIAEVARAHGAEVPFMRPAELASDTAPEWLAWQHAIRSVEALDGKLLDVLVALPTTAPLRGVEDVDACVNLLLESDADVVVTVTPAQRNPYFNMVQIDGEGCARLYMKGGERIARRQDAPAAFDMTTVAYAAHRNFVMSAGGIFDGKVKAVVVPRERALDIDDEMDLKIAEILMGAR